MNFYDKVHELVRSFKQTEEYEEYIKLKKKLKENKEAYDMVKDFKSKQQEQQVKHINGTRISDSELNNLQNLYSILIQNEDIRKLLEYEMKLDVYLADMQKIIADGIKELVEY